MMVMWCKKKSTKDLVFKNVRFIKMLGYYLELILAIPIWIMEKIGGKSTTN